MFKKELLRATPESEGISSKKLFAMVKELETCGTEMHGLMITRHDRVILEGWWAPYTADGAHICHSMGKSYIGTAVGRAITDGRLHLSDKIIDLFRDEIRELGITPNENMKQLTIEHVLKMSNGMSIHPASGENLLKNYLTSDFDHEPGKRFLYNTTGSCMLGAAVQKVTGKTVWDYLYETVFHKIGVENDKLRWLAFHGNGIYAAPGVASSTENNLRLGLLYLNYGEWDGEQLIDRDWMDAATHRQIFTQEINPEAHLQSEEGYGYQLWICKEKDTFKFSGGHGQDVLMSRLNDLAVSVNQAANDGNYAAQEEIFSRYLLQEDSFSREALPEDPESFEALQNYLKNLALPDRAVCEKPEELGIFEGIYRLTDGELHINTELRPYDSTNVYTDFYDHEDVNTRLLSIHKVSDGLELVFDDGTICSRILARLDGRLQPIATRGAIPSYTETISNAYTKDGKLIVESKFLQTCFRTFLTFEKTENGLEVEILKERLHEADPYIKRRAELVRIR